MNEQSPFGWYVYRMLMEAEDVTRTYQRAGQNWTVDAQASKMQEEYEEVWDAVNTGETKARIAEEISDVIFSALTMSHLVGITPEAMQHAMRGKLRVIQERANDKLFVAKGERPY